jgi:hypothetical protein
MVFKVRMAMRGLSTSFFNTSNSNAKDLPSFFIRLIKVCGTLNSTASKIEHIKDTRMDMSA